MKQQQNTPHSAQSSNELSNSDSSKKRRAWGPRRRLAQRQRIYKVKPWLRACGPRTSAGLAISSQNALKSGVYDRLHKNMRRALRRHGRFLRMVRQCRYRFPDWLLQEGWIVTSELILASDALVTVSERHES